MRTLEEQDGVADVWYAWLTGMHWAVCQLHGAMEVHAHNVYERGFVFGVGFMACVLYPLVISSATAHVVRVQELHRERSENDARMSELLDYYNVNPHLKSEVSKQVAALAYRKQKGHTDQILQALPQALQSEIHQLMRLPVTRSYALVRYVSDSFAQLCRRLCQFAMSQLPLGRRQRIFACGEVRPAMVFVEWGQLRYVRGREFATVSERLRAYSDKKGKHTLDSFGAAEPAEEAQLHLLNELQWLSEAALFVRWRAVGDAHTERESVIVSLEAAALRQEASRFPTALADMALYAHHFIRVVVQREGPNGCTDLPISIAS